MFGEVGPQRDNVPAQLPLCVGELLDVAVDGHLVGKAAAERRSEHVVELDRVEAAARRREMIFVDVGAVRCDQVGHLVRRRYHVHVR